MSVKNIMGEHAQVRFAHGNECEGLSKNTCTLGSLCPHLLTSRVGFLLNFLSACGFLCVAPHRCSHCRQYHTLPLFRSVVCAVFTPKPKVCCKVFFQKQLLSIVSHVHLVSSVLQSRTSRLVLRRPLGRCKCRLGTIRHLSTLQLRAHAVQK